MCSITFLVSINLFYVSRSGKEKEQRAGERKTKLVFHSTNNPYVWGTAENNAKYLIRKSGAGAHFVIDDKERWQIADEDKAVAAVGGPKWYNFKALPWLDGKITNRNSLNWEICLGWNRDNEGMMDTVAAEFGYYLVKYGLEPGSVVRHHDATGKYCPFFGQLYLSEKEYLEFWKNPAGSGYYDKITEDRIFYLFKLRVTYFWLYHLHRVGKLSDADFARRISDPKIQAYGTRKWVFPEYPIKGIERRVRTNNSPLN